MTWSDLLAFIARDPLVVVLLALLLGMACVIIAGLIVTFWRDAEAQAEQRRRQELERVMQAGTPKAAGWPHKRVS